MNSQATAETAPSRRWKQVIKRAAFSLAATGRSADKFSSRGAISWDRSDGLHTYSQNELEDVFLPNMGKAMKRDRRTGKLYAVKQYAAARARDDDLISYLKLRSGHHSLPQVSAVVHESQDLLFLLPENAIDAMAILLPLIHRRESWKLRAVAARMSIDLLSALEYSEQFVNKTQVKFQPLCNFHIDENGKLLVVCGEYVQRDHSDQGLGYETRDAYRRRQMTLDFLRKLMRSERGGDDILFMALSLHLETIGRPRLIVPNPIPSEADLPRSIFDIIRSESSYLCRRLPTFLRTAVSVSPEQMFEGGDVLFLKDFRYWGHRGPPESSIPPQRICNIKEYVYEGPPRPGQYEINPAGLKGLKKLDKEIYDAQGGVYDKYIINGNIPEKWIIRYWNPTMYNDMRLQHRFGTILPALSRRYNHQEDRLLLVHDFCTSVQTELKYDRSVEPAKPIFLVIPRKPEAMPYWTFEDQTAAEYQGPLRLCNKSIVENGYTASLHVHRNSTTLFHYEMDEVKARGEATLGEVDEAENFVRRVDEVNEIKMGSG